MVGGGGSEAVAGDGPAVGGVGEVGGGNEVGRTGERDGASAAGGRTVAGGVCEPVPITGELAVGGGTDVEDAVLGVGDDRVGGGDLGSRFGLVAVS